MIEGETCPYFEGISIYLDKVEFPNRSFDTGSSLFPLVSSPSKIAQISDIHKIADAMIVSSWGVEETVYGYTPEVNISLGANKLPPLPVYTSPGLDDETLEAVGF